MIVQVNNECPGFTAGERDVCTVFAIAGADPLTETATLHPTDDTTVSVTFVDDEQMRALNAEYRGIDATTDVLSFPLDDTELLGDIVVSPAQTDDIPLMLVHGYLHLCGYDHETDDQAAEMDAVTDRILKQWRSSTNH
ncbi:MAG: rRNA maturation RNase YbeY [Actinomycetes bacterium]|jgi:rRNA maturation RNase YbeY|nr:rRNA maturation RNase YbeY [Actinomycetes bacterium]